MKRALIVVLALALTLPAFADARTEKRHLISELLEVLDVKGMTQNSFDAILLAIRGMTDQQGSGSGDVVPEEYRAQWEERRRTEEEQMRKFRDRLFSRIDFVKFAEEAYVPIFDEHFSSEELKELIVFFRTKPGQKFAAMIAELGVGGIAKGKGILNQAAEETQKELQKEEQAKHPWRPTMADMRMIATALEARATDENEYPAVSFEELEGLLTPTYIRQIPKVDAWGTPYVYVGNREHYRVVSAGADRHFDWSSRQLDPNDAEQRTSESVDADIIFQDGTFIRYPAESAKVSP